MLSVLATFWMIGNITVAGMAWIIVPTKWGYVSDSFKFNSWRIFVLACGIPALLVAISMFYMPESPKFLLTKGRDSQALKVMAKIYSQNTGNPESSYPVNEKNL